MELNMFLLEAKAHSYSTGEEGTKLPDGWKEFVYSAHGYTYRDRYIGEDPFIGEEIVWKDARAAILEGLAASAAGKLPAKGPRGGSRWTARYFVRRVAWHALDHAWEIEDRA
jgi:hypothetical protein